MDTRVSPPGLDKLPEQVERHLGGLNDDWLLAADLIVASPGMALAHPSLSAAADAGVEIVGDIELFCREAQAPVIAITGSNGKAPSLPWWVRWRKRRAKMSALAATLVCRR